MHIEYETSCVGQSPPPGLGPGQYCPAVHDQILCWPATPENTTAREQCHGTTVYAHRHCNVGGVWDNMSDYIDCINALDTTTMSDERHDMDYETAKIVSTIMFVGGIISLCVLAGSLVIFLWFKSLQCQRTSIHKNLIVSFMLRFLMIVILAEPVVFNHLHNVWFHDHPWVCRSLYFLQHFSEVANFYWMLVEGFFLHLILVLRPMDNQKAPFLLFYFIGWVVPLCVTIAWAVVMHIEYDKECWMGNTKLIYILIIYVPIMLALLINFLILLNLIRIVIAKLCSGHSNERRKICRTIKSTVLLVFLLGIINLVFFYSPKVEGSARTLYTYINAVLPSLQGIFISLLYCVMNAEVQRAIKKRWARFKDTRAMGNSTGYLRRRSSRTSMSMIVSSKVSQIGQNRGVKGSPYW